jgi:histidinol-phosphate aminotransferase
VRRIVTNRQWFCSRLSALGLAFPSSSGNFVLVEVPATGALAQNFLLEAGVLVKDATAMGFANHVRIGIGTLEDMQLAVNALSRLLSAHDNHRLPCRDAEVPPGSASAAALPSRQVALEP